MKGEFRYYNRTVNTIRVSLVLGMEKAYASYTLAPGDSFVINTSGIGEKVADPEKYVPGIASDTTTIRFNDTLCYSEYMKKGPVLHNNATHTYLKRGDNDYIFYFNIDTILYNLATRCP
ncbi:MAG: hypothetical protein K0Q79_821 [Flavipsychrobacter sp.]|nr:hypothetical protein [Flavipsychrobacter sp.]